MSDEKFNIDIDEMLSGNLEDNQVGADKISDKVVEKKSKNRDESEKPDFEESLKELDRIVEELQRSDLALDRSMYLFRRGTELVQICREQLNAAEHEVKELLADGSEVDYVPEN